MILFLAAVAASGLLTGSFVGGWMNRRARAARSGMSLPSGIASQSRASGSGDGGPPLEGFACALGDVVLLAHGEDAWLAGALLFRERAAHPDEAGDDARTVAALFLAHEQGEPRAVYARPAPTASLDWMWPVPAGDVVVGAEPPSAVEHDGQRFERVRRLPLAVVAVGSGVPHVGDASVIGEYDGGSGACLLVVIGSSKTLVWRGRRLEPGMFDVLPGGTAARA